MPCRLDLWFAVRCLVAAGVCHARDDAEGGAGPTGGLAEDLALLQVAPPLAGQHSHRHRTRILRADRSYRATQDESPQRYVSTLYNYEDIEYSVHFSLGGQMLRGLLDTGSFELLVISKECASEQCGNNPNLYDHKHRSHTNLKWRKVHSFGSGECSSRLASDELTLGHYSGVRQAFWQVYDSKMSILSDGSFEAVIGMGNPKEPTIEIEQFVADDEKLVAECEPTNSCQEWLKNQTHQDLLFRDAIVRHPPLLKNLNIQVFSICLQQENGANGYWIWNDDDPRRTPDLFVAAPVTGSSEWSVSLGAVAYRGGRERFQDEVLGCDVAGDCEALFDTGTSLIIAPSETVKVMQEKLQLLDSDCDKIGQMPQLVLTFGKHTVVLPPEAYIGRVVGAMPSQLRAFFPQFYGVDFRSDDLSNTKTKGQCSILIMSGNMVSDAGKPLWVLGMPFFRQYFTSFVLGKGPDYNKRSVHMAPADRGCSHPSRGQLRAFAAAPPVTRTLDVSKLRVPEWKRHMRAEHRAEAEE